MKLALLSNASVGHTARWLDHFRARGHDVKLWSLEPGTDGVAAEPLPRFPLPGALRYPLAVPALKRALAAFAPDLVNAHYVPNYGLMGALAGRRPLVVVAWGSDLLVSGPRDPLQRARARFVLRRADRVIADSGNLAAAARALGAAPERVLEIPWGVDPERFRPREPREPGLLLSTRMHERIYDLPVILEAARSVMAARPQVRLVVTGDGSQRAALESLAAALLPAGRYDFVGRVAPEVMAGWLSRAEVYLSASRSDSTSVSLLEAMAAGALPVVSDLEGNREWVLEGEGARLFPVGDAAALARAIERALGEPAWAEGARERNRRVILERGSWPRNMARIEAEFESLVRAARAGAGGSR